MAFVVRFQKGSNGDEAEIRSVDATQLNTSFIEAVKQCVAKRVLDITLNTTGVESEYAQFKDSLIKLNQFLASKGHRLKVLGSSLPAEVQAELQQNGISLLKGIVDNAAEFRSLIQSFEETGKLPPPAVLTSDAESQRILHNQLRDQLEKLENELKSFRSHKDIMMKNKISVETAKKELGKLQDKGEKTKQSLDEISKKKTELVKLTAQLEEEEKRFSEFIKKSDQENKKKEDTAKKEVEAEKSRFSKLEQEFTKKSDARLAEIKKLQSKPADPAKK